MASSLANHHRSQHSQPESQKVHVSHARFGEESLDAVVYVIHEAAEGLWGEVAGLRLDELEQRPLAIPPTLEGTYTAQLL